MFTSSWARLVALVVLGAVAVVPTATAGDESCTGDSPAAILSCLQRVYAEMDSTAYANLLASDYVGSLVSRDGRTSTWDRAEDLSMVGKSFRSGMGSSSVTYAPGYSVTKGDAPDTWVISNLSSTATYSVHRSGKTTPVTVTAQGELGVRLVSIPSPHYELIWAKQFDEN